MPTAPTGAGVFRSGRSAHSRSGRERWRNAMQMGKSRGCECMSRRLRGAEISYAICVRLSTAREKAIVRCAR